MSGSPQKSTLLEVEQETNIEAQALQKRLHKPLRKWYRKQSILRSEHGKFPLFWQDMSGWTAFNDVYKAYLKSSETSTSSNVNVSLSKSNKEDTESASTEPNPSPLKEVNTISKPAAQAVSQSSSMKKTTSDTINKKIDEVKPVDLEGVNRRRARWGWSDTQYLGTAVFPASSSDKRSLSETSPTEKPEKKRRRKSRWAVQDNTQAKPMGNTRFKKEDDSNVYPQLSEWQKLIVNLRMKLEVSNRKLINLRGGKDPELQSTIEADRDKIIKKLLRSNPKHQLRSKNGEGGIGVCYTHLLFIFCFRFFFTFLT